LVTIISMIASSDTTNGVRIGLWHEMGTIAKPFTPAVRIGPPAAIPYAVLP
jgi:hypothetical protein